MAFAFPRLDLGTVGVGCILAVPVAMLLVGGEIPFITAKTIAFQGLMAVAMVCAWLQKLPDRMPLPLTLFGLFAAILLMADLSGANPLRSLMGSAPRQQGFVGTVSYLGYFFSLWVLVRDLETWKMVIWGWASAAFIAAAVSLINTSLQMFDGIPVVQPGGLMAHYNVLGAFLVFGMGFAALAASWSVTKIEKYFWSFTIVIESIVLAFCASRAAFFGAAVLGAFLFLYLPSWKMAFRVTILAALLLLINDALSSVSLLDRVISGDSSGRLIIWQTEIPLILSHLWLGHGQDNLTIWWNGAGIDRPYNLILGLMADAGIFGMLAYAAMLGAAFYLASRLQGFERYVGMGMIAAYVGIMMFSFDTITSAVPLVALLAWVSCRPVLQSERAESRIAGVVV